MGTSFISPTKDVDIIDAPVQGTEVNDSHFFKNSSIHEYICAVIWLMNDWLIVKAVATSLRRTKWRDPPSEAASGAQGSAYQRTWGSGPSFQNVPNGETRFNVKKKMKQNVLIEHYTNKFQKKIEHKWMPTWYFFYECRSLILCVCV